jgi:leucyl-tRNA synthetase
MLLAPMTPHITAELWERRHPGEPSVHHQSWPEADAALVKQEMTTMVVEINGKVRARLQVSPEINEDDARTAAMANPTIQQALSERSPQRVVVRPPRLVNIIV